MQLQILLLAAVVAAAMASLGTANGELDSSCETSCGNVTYSFPFGSGEGCYHSPDFFVNCSRSSSGQPVPYLRKSNLIIANMSTNESEMEINALVAADCYNRTGQDYYNIPYLRLSNFRISTKNMFVAIGCDTRARIRIKRGTDYFDSTGCISTCGSQMSNITNGSCSGVGCCQVPIPQGINSYRITVNSYNNHTDILDFNPCSYAFVVAPHKFNFSTNNLHDFAPKRMPMLLEWAIGNETCQVARKNTGTNFLCKGNSECDKEYGGPGYRCRCKPGYAGNPYIENNCTNINECGPKDPSVCKHECVDHDGYYECKCPKGFSGGDKKDGSGCIPDKSLVIQIVLGTFAAAIFLLISVSWLYLGLKKRKLIMLKEKFFKQNGGIMLQQRISGEGSSHHDQAKVFTIEELKRATNNYDETRIIGKGGYGTVYKGVLSDKRTVAIKKSKLVDQTQSQIEQFINEVVILSQINHRNVVKLIGCCLETEVPLLVYEFISNGTLSDHIHNESRSLALTWDIRLRIATKTAEALSYLHSAASVPIIHRDIKPTNILLDDDYVAKVSDFGASKLIPMDQIELATIVQGTLGYLDPEYLQTNQLTDKSDVYSFGVVLVELLSGRKALSFDRPDNEKNLAMYFLSCLKEGKLFEVLDEHLLLNEVVPSEIIIVSRLAERCLRVKGDERPTMKEVAMELEGILASMIQKHPWVQTTSNEEEYEYLLKQPMDDQYECTAGANSKASSSSTFDSMISHAILPIASGR